MQRAVLWGHDHVELGVTASEAAGDGAGVAISRGGFAKLYSYVDPNEDVAAAVQGRDATLLVVADGHYGITAPRVAVETVLAQLGEDPPPALADPEWLELFDEVNRRILEATAAGEQRQSATVLVCALVRPGSVSWAAAGDGAVLKCAPGAARGRQLNREAMRFMGHPMKPRALKQVVGRGNVALGADDWVVLASDGLSEFVIPERPSDVVPRLLFDALGQPESAARKIVDHACARGAGDNVAVALSAPRG